MQVVINGAAREWADAMTVSRLLAELGLTGRRVAVEINREAYLQLLGGATGVSDAVFGALDDLPTTSVRGPTRLLL